MIALISTLKQFRQEGDRWVFVFSRYPKRKGQCRVRHCKRPARTRVRIAATGFRIETCRACITCESRLFRANNPAWDAYRQIRDRAKRRNQIFRLTFAQFLKEIEGTNYVARRGTGVHELHLDRVKVHLGYVPGNLKVITAAENLRKQREVDYAKGPF